MLRGVHIFTEFFILYSPIGDNICFMPLYSLSFCKSSMSLCDLCQQGSSRLLAYPLRLPQAFPVVTDCMFEPIVQLRLYYVMPCQPLARYMKPHFHFYCNVSGLPFSYIYLFSHEHKEFHLTLLLHQLSTISGLRLPPIFGILFRPLRSRFPDMIYMLIIDQISLRQSYGIVI